MKLTNEKLHASAIHSSNGLWHGQVRIVIGTCEIEPMIIRQPRRSKADALADAACVIKDALETGELLQLHRPNMVA